MPDSDKDRPDRDRRLNIPVSEDEKDKVRIEAAKARKSMAEYVRDQLFGKHEAVPA